MRRFFHSIFDRREPARRKNTYHRYVPPIPEPYTQASVTIGPVQLESMLFDLLSAELRLLVYEGVLTDSTRLLHISPYPVRGDGMSHWRCEDVDSPHHTWQHTCFGIFEINSRIRHRVEPRSNDNLVNLLLVCRRIYVEAIGILYQSNTFSFKGAAGVLTFRSRLPQAHWQRLRHVQISTSFLTPQNLDQDLPMIRQKVTRNGDGCAML